MAKKKSSAAATVRCRYPKCSKLHESNELLKSEAYSPGTGRYYHPDCYHTMQTVNEIRDLFYKEINPMMTGQQIGMLVSTINNIVFGKHVDVDYLKFVVKYFINNKPGALKYPAGLHYVIQDKDAASAWEREKNRKYKEELKKQMQKAVNELGEIFDNDIELDFGTEDSKFTYKHNNKPKFSSILGV